MSLDVHVAPCKHCPSARHTPDEEAIDIKESYPRAEQIRTVFACAWCPEKLCKAYCDYLNVTPEELQEVALEREMEQVLLTALVREVERLRHR